MRDLRNRGHAPVVATPKPAAPPIEGIARSVHVWTDGSCVPNPGPGGWAAVVVMPDGKQIELSGAESRTTNNRMEIMAVIAGLESLPDGFSVIVYSDSTYVTGGVVDPVKRQKKANSDLWARFIAAAARHTIAVRKVPAHSGVALNERCDVLADMARAGVA